MAELTKVVPNACLSVANAQITDNANLLMFLAILNFSHKFVESTDTYFISAKYNSRLNRSCQASYSREAA